MLLSSIINVLITTCRV